MRTTRPATPPTQPSSAEAAEWPIAERNASLIISRFNVSDDSYLRRPGKRSPPWTGAENLASSKHYGFALARNLSTTGWRGQEARCATRQIVAPLSRPPWRRAADHFAAMLSRVGQGRRSAGIS